MGLTVDRTQLKRFCNLGGQLIENIKTQAQDLGKKTKKKQSKEDIYNITQTFNNM